MALLNERAKEESTCIARLTAEIEKVIVGQKYLIDRLLVGLLANGHMLIEGVPGLAKTLIVNTILGLIILVIANFGFNMNVPYNLPVLLVVALGGIPGAVLVILLHAFQIAF